jgi:thiamine-phosphate pyrophosphorylase
VLSPNGAPEPVPLVRGVKLPRLMVITDWTLPEERHWAALEAVAALGSEVALQHRDPEAPIRKFLERAQGLARLCQRTGAHLFVNGRLDVALLAGAHLHLPVDGPRPSEVRAHLPAGRWVSAAVHSTDELATSEGADLVLISPVFKPGSKPSDRRPQLGAEGFLELASRAAVPAFALGGIDRERVRSLRPCAGVAVQSSVLRATDPAGVARQILASLPA